MASDSPSPVFSWQFIVMIAATLGILMVQPGSLPFAPGKTSANTDQAGVDAAAPVLTDSRLWADPFDNTPPKSDPSRAGTAVAVAGLPMGLAAPEVTASG